MNKLTADQCIVKLKRYVKGTEWDQDNIEWFGDQDRDNEYIWKATNPETRMTVSMICNKIDGTIKSKIC